MPPRITDRVYKAIRYACNAMMALQVVLVCYIVFARFVLNNSPAWGEELALLFMVWFCLLSPPEALRDDRHLCISVLQERLPGPVMKAVDLLNHALIAAFAAFMIIEGSKLTLLTSRNTLPGLGLPASILYASVPVSGVVLIIAAIERIVAISLIPSGEYRAKSCKD